MNKNAIIKTTLISLTVVLACVYIAQLALTGRSKVKTLTLSDSPDQITIVQGNSANGLTVKFEGDKPVVGKSSSGAVMYPATSSTVTSMVSLLKEIKLLGTVTSGVNANTAERYGLDDSSKITVTAYRNGTVIRTLTVGKNTSTGSQCYVQVDGKATVYLEDKPLHSTFDCTVDSLRNKEVYSFDSTQVQHVRITSSEGVLDLVKSVPQVTPGQENIPQAAWTVAENTTPYTNAIDESALTSWLRTTSTLNVSEWAADTATLPSGTPDSTVEFTVAGKNYTVAVYALPDDDSKRSLCSSSASPYRFYLNEAGANKYKKTLADFAAK